MIPLLVIFLRINTAQAVPIGTPEEPQGDFIAEAYIRAAPTRGEYTC